MAHYNYTYEVGNKIDFFLEKRWKKNSFVWLKYKNRYPEIKTLQLKYTNRKRKKKKNQVTLTKNCPTSNGKKIHPEHRIRMRTWQWEK